MSQPTHLAIWEQRMEFMSACGIFMSKLDVLANGLMTKEENKVTCDDCLFNMGRRILRYAPATYNKPMKSLCKGAERIPQPGEMEPKVTWLQGGWHYTGDEEGVWFSREERRKSGSFSVVHPMVTIMDLLPKNIGTRQGTFFFSVVFVPDVLQGPWCAGLDVFADKGDSLEDILNRKTIADKKDKLPGEACSEGHGSTCSLDRDVCLFLVISVSPDLEVRR